MTRFSVVLVPFPFDDLSSTKVRPAVCLTQPIGPHRHVVLAFLTSRIPQEPLPSDLVISQEDPEFEATGLHKASTLQLHRLLTVGTELIRRQLGALGPSLQRRAKARLQDLLDLNGR